MALSPRPLNTTHLNQLQRRGYFPTGDVPPFAQDLMGATDTADFLDRASIPAASLTPGQFFYAGANGLVSLSDEEMAERIDAAFTDLALPTQTEDFSLTFQARHPVVIAPYSGTVQVIGVSGFPAASRGFTLITMSMADASILTFDVASTFIKFGELPLNPPTSAGSVAFYNVYRFGLAGFPRIAIEKRAEFAA